jgi:hypothetical protein
MARLPFVDFNIGIFSHHVKYPFPNSTGGVNDYAAGVRVGTKNDAT